MLTDRDLGKVIADLKWLLSGPLLWVPEEDDGIEAMRAGSWRRLEGYLANGPGLDLEQLVEKAGGEPRSHRLGHYYEWLVRLWLSLDSRYRLVAHNEVIQSAGQTLGELDFVIEDRDRGDWIHLEVAVKFYLGLGGESQGLWFGPGLQDRLDKKYYALNRQQMARSRDPAAAKQLKSLGWPNQAGRQRRMGLVCGALFSAPGDNHCPRGIHPGHRRGHWYRQSEVLANNTLRRQLRPLAKWDWLTPGGGEGQRLSLEARHPQAVVDERGRMHFVVPDDWPQRAWQQRRLESVHWQQCYAGTRFAIEWEGGRVTLSAGSEGGEALPEGIWLGANNPGRVRPLEAAENRRRREELERRLQARGLDYVPAPSSDSRGDYPEEGVFVVGAATEIESEVMALAQSLGQVAVWHWHPQRGGRLHLV